MYTFKSDENIYDQEEAYKSAIDNITLENYRIVSVINDSYFCEECRDYHYTCTIVVDTNNNIPTDMEILLNKFLKN